MRNIFHLREKSFYPRTKKSSLVTDGAILKAKYHPHGSRTKFKACHRCKLMNMKILRLCTSNSVSFLLEKRSKARDSFVGRIPRPTLISLAFLPLSFFLWSSQD